MKLPPDLNPFLLLAAGVIVGFVMVVIVEFFLLDLFLMITTGDGAPPRGLSWFLDRFYPK